MFQIGNKGVVMNKKEKQVYEKTLELFNGCCAICGNTPVAMHHIRYGACGRKTYMGNVIPLCPPHHGIVHSSKKTYQPLLIGIMKEKMEGENDRNKM